MDFQQAVKQFSDWRWRLNNLYWIVGKDGRKQRFEMNWAQESLYNEMHYLNVVLKARQLGFTTFIQIFMLDAALFNSDIRAGTIAHTLDDAKVIFRDKVKFPYDNLPDQLKAAIPIINDNATELMLGNNSSIRVGVSLRSGTLQYLHISEYGKICAKYPEKAREIRTGALNTVDRGQLVFMESTAEGQGGHFHDVCEESQAMQRKGVKLSDLDFKFHFYPWWKNPGYELEPASVVIPAGYMEYFDKLQKLEGIALSDRKKAWYVIKAKTQGADMKREYPSTPKEAFEASVEGAYYGDQIAKAELEGRIGVVEPLPGVPVDTIHDIGVSDNHSIWFTQKRAGKIGVLAYYQNSGEGAPFYLRKMYDMAIANGWQYGRHFFPHDAKVKEWGTGLTRIEQLQKGIILPDGSTFKVKPHLVPMHSVDDGINAAREIFGICYFDEAKCSDGLKGLRNYKKEWDEEHSIWKEKPLHNWASHPADAFRYLAISHREPKPPAAPPAKPRYLNDMTANELFWPPSDTYKDERI